jgi:hypothetical protein
MNVFVLSCFGLPLIVTSVDVKTHMGERIQEQKNRH